MGWRVGGGGVGPEPGFPRVRARIHELRRAAELAAMHAELAENGKGAGHRFRYQQLMAELTELGELLRVYEIGEERLRWGAWSSWQVWGLLLAWLVSMVLSGLALIG